jgi:RHS repeat-associated protein
VISGCKVGSAETAVSKVVTNYAPCACSPIGKVEWVTMPIAPTADPSTAAKTVYLYDALGRTVKVTPPGNAGFTSYVYEGRTVKTVDPKGDWKRMEQDAIGNLVKVYEPRPGGGADYVTEYSYSVLGQLLKVRMERPSVLGNNPTVVQERLFTYNTKEQLVSETQPEHGTTTPGVTTHVYNFDGSLQEKTDPKGQKVQWFYDALGRPTEAKKLLVGGTEDTCGKVKYQYDSQDKDGTFAGTNLAGRVASVETGCSARGGLVQELYSYNVAGAVTTKRVRIVRGSSTVTKNIGYTFDAEGKLATVQYPDVSIPFTYFYDNMGRPNRMTGIGWDSDQGTITSDHVNGVSYGLGGELLGMTYLQSSPMEQQQNRWFVETRSYNSRLQLTRQTTALNAGATVTDVKYNFSATANDGRIESRENVVSGEVVNYQYDFLKRLTSATQTAPVVQPPDLQWGLSFTYDGFGNRWNQTIQPGKKGLTSTLTFDEARNRITGQFWQYDANGNTTGMPQTSDLSYDVDNRLLTITREGSAEAYGYLADNKRFWKSAGGVESYYLYGVGGQRILTYSATFSGGVLTLGGSPKMDVVFAGRVIRTNGVAVVMDRLGSVVTRSTGAGTVVNHRYYPYGEEIEGTVGDRTKFGTYHRDQSGVDYADQRYYPSTGGGRFLTVDPVQSGSNWYAYAGGDPINFNDPAGLTRCGDLVDTRSGATVRQLMGSSTEDAMLAKMMWHEAGPVKDADRENLSAFDSEQLMIGTALLNRLDIAKEALIIFDNAGQVTSHGFKGKDLRAIIMQAAIRRKADNSGTESIFDSAGNFILSEQIKLATALNSTIEGGNLFPIPSNYVNNGVEELGSVTQLCYGVLRAITNMYALRDGKRENGSTPNTVITSWNLADNSPPGFESITVKARPIGNTFYGYIGYKRMVGRGVPIPVERGQ